MTNLQFMSIINFLVENLAIITALFIGISGWFFVNKPKFKFTD